MGTGLHHAVGMQKKSLFSCILYISEQYSSQNCSSARVCENSFTNLEGEATTQSWFSFYVNQCTKSRGVFLVGAIEADTKGKCDCSMQLKQGGLSEILNHTLYTTLCFYVQK